VLKYILIKDTRVLDREESCLFLAQPKREKRERGRKERKGVEERKERGGSNIEREPEKRSVIWSGSPVLGARWHHR
jgi:hypothetical protein